MHIRQYAASSFVIFLLLISPGAMGVPQQGWYLETSWDIPFEDGFLGAGLVVDSTGSVYTFAKGDSFGVRVFDQNGVWLNPSPPSVGNSIVPNINANLFLETLDDRLIFGQATGALIEICEVTGCSGQIYDSEILSILSDVAHSADGTYFLLGITSGSLGAVEQISADLTTSLNSFEVGFSKEGIAIGENGDLLLVFSGGVHTYSTSGQLLEIRNFPEGSVTSFSPNDTLGELMLGINSGILVRNSRTLALIGRIFPTMSFGSLTRGFDRVGNDLVFLQIGNISTDARRVFRFRRAYRTYDPAKASIPIPEIITAESRQGTTLFDIDYKVEDSDSAFVTTGIIGLESGTRDLGSAIPVRAVLSGQVGPGTATGVVHSLVWDAGADLSSPDPFINAQLLLYAQDERGILPGVDLIDLHFISILSSVCTNEMVGGDLKISVSPISDDELLDMWLWLISSQDIDIDFSNGEVRGTVSSGFDGALLAFGTTTNNDGRTFLFNRMGLREATNNEVQCAGAGTSGVGNQFPPSNRFGTRPEFVNELGFDTGTSVTGYWAVDDSP